MPKDVDEIVIGANGSVWVAPLGTPVPADESAVPNANWVDLGFTNEDGVTLVDSKTQEVVRGWQSFYALRRFITERDFSAAFVLHQWGPEQVMLAFGGGEFTEPTSGHYRYDPPDPEHIDERMLMVDWIDGDKRYRLVLERGLVTENVETNITRTAAADLPITFGIIGDESGTPWHLLSNDPAFEGASS